MGKKIKDIDGHRWLQFDGEVAHRPDSVFVMGSNGLCVEFNKMAFYAAILLEFGLPESVSAGAERFLANA